MHNRQLLRCAAPSLLLVRSTNIDAYCFAILAPCKGAEHLYNRSHQQVAAHIEGAQHLLIRRHIQCCALYCVPPIMLLLNNAAHYLQRSICKPILIRATYLKITKHCAAINSTTTQKAKRKQAILWISTNKAYTSKAL